MLNRSKRSQAPHLWMVRVTGIVSAIAGHPDHPQLQHL